MVFDYEQIQRRYKRVEDFLMLEKYTVEQFIETFLELLYDNFSVEAYIEYMNKYRLVFEITAVQLKEWLKKNMFNENLELYIYGY